MISNSSFRKNLNEINNNSMNSQLQKNTCNTMANKSALPNVSSYNHSSNLPLQHSMQPSPTNSRNRSQINNHNHVQPINHKSQMHANHNGWANHVTNNDTSCSTGSYFEQQPNQNRKMINPNLNPNLNPYVTNTNTHLSASPIGDVSKTNGQSKPIIASTSVDQSNLIATKSSPKLLCQDTKIMCVNDYVTDNPVFPNPSRIHRPAICPKPQEIQGQQPQVKREKSPVVSMDSHTLPESNKLKSMARVQTLISFKIVEQIILDDKVVKETVLKDENIRRNGGFIFWPEEDDERLQTSSDMIPANAIRNSTNISSITTSSNQIGFAKVSNLSCDPSPMPNTPDTPTTIEATSLDEIKPSTVNSNQSSNQFCLNHSPSTSVSVNSPNTDFNATSSLSSKMRATTTAPPTKVGSASSRPIEDVKRKEFGMYQALSPSTDAISSTCSSVTTIISSSSCSVVNTPSPNNAYPDGKKIETHSSIMNKRSYFDSDLDDVSFRPIENNCRVLAKWSDKNFYAGKIAEKINDNKWLVQFDDGGRRTVGENEIISVDHLPIGQQVMVTFATGFCVKGRVKSHRLADTTLELYYLIEHLTNSHVAESEYRASDVFLNFDHALVLLGKRKGPAHVSKFADVDLNNIIPKRARVANKSMTASSGSAGESNERSCRSSSSNNNTINFDMDLDSNSSSTSIGLLNQSADGKNERCVKSAKKRDKPNKLNGSSNKSQLKMLPGQLDFSGIGSTDIGFEVTSPTSNRKTDQLPSLFSSADQISCDLGSTSLNPSVSSNNNVALLNSATSSNHMSNTYNNEPSTPNPITSAPHTPMSAGSVHQTMQLETATEPSTPASVFESGDYKESFEIDRPEFNSSLFKSLGIVVLNCSDKVQASDNISEMTKSVQFNRDILIRLLEFGSGSIFDRVEDALANSFCKRLILIAKKHSRQVKYLQCVASGIDCLNYLWVYDCIQQNQLLDFNNYLLPTGYSILQNCLINDR